MRRRRAGDDSGAAPCPRLAILAGATRSAWAPFDIELHALLANPVWAYLIGHSGTALPHHFSGRRPLDVMWRR